jgi:hypothetical protein
LVYAVAPDGLNGAKPVRRGNCVRVPAAQFRVCDLPGPEVQRSEHLGDLVYDVTQPEQHNRHDRDRPEHRFHLILLAADDLTASMAQRLRPQGAPGL